MQTHDYLTQAQSFLSRNEIRFRATLSDSKTAPWDGPSGHHYRVTLSRDKITRNRCCGIMDDGRQVSSRITFDFFGSRADLEVNRRNISAYDVLSCISGDVNCPETFKDFCDNYGYHEDSIKALQTFRRCSRFGKRLREFFTPEEVEQLQEIQ